MSERVIDDALWRRIEPLLPKPARRRSKAMGRPRLPDRAALTGILFVLRSGIPWQMLPKEMGCGSGSTCWRRLVRWHHRPSIEKASRTLPWRPPHCSYTQRGITLAWHTEALFPLIVTLRLAIGANTAIFSVVYDALLRPLPYADPAGLIVLNETHPRIGTISVSYPNFLDWRTQNHVFSSMALVAGVGYNLAGVAQPETINESRLATSWNPTLQHVLRSQNLDPLQGF
jgi:transposase